MHIHLKWICIKLTSLLQTRNSRKQIVFSLRFWNRESVYILYSVMSYCWRLVVVKHNGHQNIYQNEEPQSMNPMKGKEKQSFKGKTGHERTIMMIDYRLTDRRGMEDTWPFRNQQDQVCPYTNGPAQWRES